MTRDERERVEALTLRMLDDELASAETDELEALLEDPDALELHGLLLEQEAALRGGIAELDLVDRTVTELESGKRIEAGVLRTIEREELGWWPWLQAGYRLAMVAVLALAVVFGGSAAWVLSWSAPPQEALVFASKTIEPGAPLRLKALVRNAQSLVPYANTEVRVALTAAGGSEVWRAQATTDAQGAVTISDAVPELPEGSYTLRLVADTPGHQATVTRQVLVARHYRIYVTTDKPRYQPGQTIHVRALAMTASPLVPAGERDLVFRIRDAKGNLVLKKSLKTTAHGLASTDLELADQVNMGRYSVSASIGSTTSERTVLVERYVLPKLKVEVETSEPFYTPGAKVEGTVSATYVFGEPVEDAEVRVELQDARSGVQMSSVTASPSKDGEWRFTAHIPQRFGAIEPSELSLVASVTDRAGFHNEGRVARMVTTDRLLVDVAAAGGQPVMGVPNRFYLAFRTPDGKPASAEGTFGGVPFEADTSGLAMVKLTPGTAPTATVVVDGLRREVTLNSQHGILITSDRSVYDGGASMRLSVYASAPQGTAFVDAVQGGRTIWTRAVELTEGGAELAFDVPADVHGPLHLRAFHVNESGTLRRSDRMVLVRAREALTIETSLDRDVYRPGETAHVVIAVTKDGEPTPAAVSLAGVDEAVFAMSEARPGMDQAFFELNRDALRTDLTLYPLDRVPSIADAERRERAAGAALAPVAPPSDILEIQGSDGFRSRANRVASSRRRWLRRIGGIVVGSPMGASIVLLLMMMWRAGRAARRDDEDARVPELTRAMRWLVVAWLGAFAVPSLALVAALSLRSENLALFGAAAAVAAMALVLHKAAEPVRPSLDVGLLLPSYVLAALGIVGLAVAEKERMLPDEAVAVAVLVAFVLWNLVAGLLAAAGHNLAASASRGRVAWLVASRTAILLVPAGLFLATAFMAVQYEDAAVPAQAVAGLPSGTGTRAKGEAVDSPDALETQGVAAETRVRSFFPETLLWKPHLITDEGGRLELDVPLADSITTWRLSMNAVTTSGEMGASDEGMRVFQPFFVEPNLPVALTQNDVIAVPVAVFNYLDTEQTVKVTVASGDWLAIDGPAARTVVLKPREVKRVSFVVEAKHAGEHRFLVEAEADDVADAVERVVTVEPDGQRVDVVHSGEVKSGEVAEAMVNVPDDAIPGSEDLVLKLYPGTFSQIVEGMEGVFRMPYGCFEQTSSVTYPSLLVLDYMLRNDAIQPEVRAKAERFIDLGYQRLLSFEVSGGGFEWFGRSPAHPVLTAYGLMEFTDMKRVRPVDEEMLARTQQWLLAQQRPDGTWSMQRAGIAEGATNAHQGEPIRTTAYIAWALSESGLETAHLARAHDKLVAAIQNTGDSYTLALIANALISADHAAAKRAVSKLSSRHVSDGDLARWASKSTGVTLGGGRTLDVEATSLAAYALLKANHDTGVAFRALAWLVKQRNGQGTWSSTQATVAAMRALLAAKSASTVEAPFDVDIVVSGETVKTIRITPENAQVFHTVSLRSAIRKGARSVKLRASEGGSVAYQVVATHYVPWEQRAQGDLSLSLSLSAEEVRVGQELLAAVVLHNRRQQRLEMAMIELPVIPGFTLDRASLDRLVSQQLIERYELAGSKVDLYVRSVAANGKLAFHYRQVAAQPARVQVPAARAYLYYEPAVGDATKPLSVRVR